MFYNLKKKKKALLPQLLEHRGLKAPSHLGSNGFWLFPWSWPEPHKTQTDIHLSDTFYAAALNQMLRSSLAAEFYVDACN